MHRERSIESFAAPNTRRERKAEMQICERTLMRQISFGLTCVVLGSIAFCTSCTTPPGPDDGLIGILYHSSSHQAQGDIQRVTPVQTVAPSHPWPVPLPQALLQQMVSLTVTTDHGTATVRCAYVGSGASLIGFSLEDGHTVNCRVAATRPLGVDWYSVAVCMRNSEGWFPVGSSPKTAQALVVLVHV